MSSSPSKSIVIVWKSYGMGESDAQELKLNLATKFSQLICDAQPLPKVMCFYTDGVKLVCQGSPLLEELRQLEKLGVQMIVCKTCIDYYGLSDKVELGIVGGMPDIISAMWQADLVVQI